MKHLRLSPALSLPPEAVTETFAILAKRGVGKTYLALVMAEEMLTAGLRVVIADPVGVCWGLRASADGKGEGLPIVVLGGDHGDVPLEVGAGETIADLVVTEGLSAVLDLSLFRKGEQVRFMTAFCERLYHRNRDPLHLVLDEADAFAPQRPMGEQTPRLLGAVEDLVRRGRARGIGVTLATQRAAVLNKDVLTQAEVLVTLRTIAPQDRKAIDEWVKVHGTPAERAKLMDSLPSLPIGTAWFWSPGWLDVFKKVKVRRRETFDSSATPKVGKRLPTPKKLAPVDLEKLRIHIAGAIERAKADDPKQLRLQINQLTRELQKAQKRQPAPAPVVREVPVLQKKEITKLVAAAEQLQKLGADILQAIWKVQGTPNRQMGAAPIAPAPASTPPPRRTPAPTASGNGEVKLRRGERKILDTLARRHPLTVTRAQLGTLAGYTPSGGTFGTYLSVLKRHELLSDDGHEIRITDDGFAILGLREPPPPQTQEEILDTWRRALRRGERVILDHLVAVYPQGISREHLGQQTGFTASGGTFGTYLSVLRRNGLAEEANGLVSASETLFLS